MKSISNLQQCNAPKIPQLQNKREYVVKHCPNYKHAEILGLTLNQYKIKLDYALRNFLRVLVELKTEKKGG